MNRYMEACWSVNVESCTQISELSFDDVPFETYQLCSRRLLFPRGFVDLLRVSM